MLNLLKIISKPTLKISLSSVELTHFSDTPTFPPGTISRPIARPLKRLDIISLLDFQLMTICDQGSRSSTFFCYSNNELKEPDFVLIISDDYENRIYGNTIAKQFGVNVADRKKVVITQEFLDHLNKKETTDLFDSTISNGVLNRKISDSEKSRLCSEVPRKMRTHIGAPALLEEYVGKSWKEVFDKFNDAEPSEHLNTLVNTIFNPIALKQFGRSMVVFGVIDDPDHDTLYRTGKVAGDYIDLEELLMDFARSTPINSPNSSSEEYSPSFELDNPESFINKEEFHKQRQLLIEEIEFEHQSIHRHNIDNVRFVDDGVNPSTICFIDVALNSMQADEKMSPTEKKALTDKSRLLRLKKLIEITQDKKQSEALLIETLSHFFKAMPFHLLKKISFNPSIEQVDGFVSGIVDACNKSLSIASKEFPFLRDLSPNLLNKIDQALALLRSHSPLSFASASGDLSDDDLENFKLS